MAILIRSTEVFTLPRFIRTPNPNHKYPKAFIRLRNNGKAGPGATVRVSGLDQGLCLYGQFSAPAKRGSKPSKDEEEKQNYYVNMGYAIRTLREEFPALFHKELSFDIYRFESRKIYTFAIAYLFLF